MFENQVIFNINFKLKNQPHIYRSAPGPLPGEVRGWIEKSDKPRNFQTGEDQIIIFDNLYIRKGLRGRLFGTLYTTKLFPNIFRRCHFSSSLATGGTLHEWGIPIGAHRTAVSDRGIYQHCDKCDTKKRNN